MAQFGRDDRSKLLSSPLDVNSVLTGAGAHFAPELCLERGVVAISMRENDGCLPPIPQTKNEYAQCEFASTDYIRSFRYDYGRRVPDDLKLDLSNFSYPRGGAENSATLQFMVRTFALSTNSWYGSATGLGLFRYSWGPVATHVRYPGSAANGFWDTPLFSLGAYQQDIDRIRQFKADLARGKGERSFVFSGVMNAIGNHLELETIQPDRISRVEVEKDGPATASIRVGVVPHGDFIADTKICSATWRVLLRPPRRD